MLHLQQWHKHFPGTACYALVSCHRHMKPTIQDVGAQYCNIQFLILSYHITENHNHIRRHRPRGPLTIFSRPVQMLERHLSLTMKSDLLSAHLKAKQQ